MKYRYINALHTCCLLTNTSMSSMLKSSNNLGKVSVSCLLTVNLAVADTGRNTERKEKKMKLILHNKMHTYEPQKSPKVISKLQKYSQIFHFNILFKRNRLSSLIEYTLHSLFESMTSS